jgi:hypothetical protein
MTEYRTFNNGRYFALFVSKNTAQLLVLSKVDGSNSNKACPFTYEDLKTNSYGILKSLVDVLGADTFWTNYCQKCN